MEEWYKVNLTILRKAASKVGKKKKLEKILETEFQNNFVKFLMSSFPDYQWDITKFSHTVRGTYADKENRRAIVAKLEQHLGIEKPQDWHQFTSSKVMDAIKKMEATAYSKFITMFKSYYHCSWNVLLTDMYPMMLWEDGLAKKRQREKMTLEQQHRLFSIIGQELKVESPQRWFEITRKEAIDAAEKHQAHLQLKRLLKLQYNGSFQEAVKRLFPDGMPEEKLDDTEFQRNILQQIGKELNIQKPEEWFKINLKQARSAARNAGVYSLFSKIIKQHYQDSVADMASSLLSIDKNATQQREQEAKDAATWEIVSQAVKTIEQELGIHRIEDWYKYGYAQIVEAINKHQLKSFNAVFSKRYSCNILKLLSAVYPHHPWDMTKFEKTLRFTFNDVENRKKLFKLVEKKMNIVAPQDWYKYTAKDVITAAASLENEVDTKKFARMFKSAYNNNLSKMVREMYPEYSFDQLKFVSTPQVAVFDIEYQKKLLDQLAMELKLKSKEDWYNVSTTDAHKAAKRIGQHRTFNAILLYYYGRSLIRMLQTVLSLNDPFRFKRVTKSALNPAATIDSLSEEEMRKLVEYVKEVQQRLHIHDVKDWLKVSTAQLAKVSKVDALKSIGGIWTILHHIYKDQLSFEDTQRVASFAHSKKSQQHLLYRMLRDLLGSEEEIQQEYTVTNSRNGATYRFDIYVPKHSLIIEYNGEQHYHAIGVFNNFREYQLQDQAKKKYCQEHSLNLITVPYLWDSTIESIAALIAWKCPNLLETMTTSAVYTNTQEGDTMQVQRLKDSVAFYESQLSKIAATSNNEYVISKSNALVGMFVLNDADRFKDVNMVVRRPEHQSRQKAKPTTLMQPVTWNMDNDPTGWWMSDKVPGVRCYWDGTHLFSSSGTRLDHVPATIRDLLPPTVHLEGELWIENDNVEMVRATILTKDAAKWSKVKFAIYDVVATADSQSKALSFEERQQILKELQRKMPSQSSVTIVDAVQCTGPEHLHDYIIRLQQENRSALLLHKPGSPYQRGTAFFFARLDINLDETTVKTVGLNTKTRALMCEQQDNGAIISVACPSLVFDNPPSEGQIITVTHCGVFPNTNKLRFPYYKGTSELV